jgi:hypothetical protein
MSRHGVHISGGAARPAWSHVMRLVLLLIAVTLASASIATPSFAYEGPWCSHRLMGGGFVDRNCGWTNYEQCRADIFATGGAWCTQNPRYVGPVGPPARKVRRRRPQ